MDFLAQCIGSFPVANLERHTHTGLEEEVHELSEVLVSEVLVSEVLVSDQCLFLNDGIAFPKVYFSISFPDGPERTVFFQFQFIVQ
jgi:hypothetical protein